MIKKYKKGYTMNHTKNAMLYLIIVCISFHSFVSVAHDDSVKESTSTPQTMPQKKEKKSKKVRCPYANSPLKKLKVEQLQEIYVYTQQHPMDPAFTIDLLERLLALSDDHVAVKKYKLELADLHYKVHHLEKAAACYEDFAVMYPGSAEHEYVLYKAVVCMFELSLDADRDQTNTKKTILLVKEFLKHAQQENLRLQGQSILQSCYDRLFDHEVYVFNFYTKKKNFTAAGMRLDFMMKNFTTMISDLPSKIADLAEKLELAKHPVKKNKSYLTKKLLA